MPQRPQRLGQRRPRRRHQRLDPGVVGVDVVVGPATVALKARRADGETLAAREPDRDGPAGSVIAVGEAARTVVPIGSDPGCVSDQIRSPGNARGTPLPSWIGSSRAPAGTSAASERLAEP